MDLSPHPASFPVATHPRNFRPIQDNVGKSSRQKVSGEIAAGGEEAEREEAMRIL